MFACKTCGHEYSSETSAKVCEIDDAADDHNNRGYFKRADPNRKD